MVSQSGMEIPVADYFTDAAFEEAVTHLWNTRKVYVEDLGYVLWTAPFTIYTEDFKNENGDPINIAGEIDMLAIDKEGNTIIIDYKTSKNSFFENGQLSLYFTSVGDNYIRSPHE
jgi:RecB family endonuclease NucS